MLFNTKCDVITLLTCHVNTMSTQCSAKVKSSTKHRFFNYFFKVKIKKNMIFKIVQKDCIC